MRAVQTAFDAAYEIIPNDERRQVALDPLNTRRLEIQARVFALNGPTTLEGAQAAALALLDQCPDGPDGAVQDGDLTRWLAIHCAEYLIREPPEIGFGPA
jgi:hypothetical protein